jgi:hypothetical protein
MIVTTLVNCGLAAFVLATTPVLQVPQPGQAVPAAAANHYRAKQILGTSIMLQGETTVGTVDDLVFDEAGNLEYMIVDNGGKLTTVPWEAAKFDLAKKTAVLTVTQQQYNSIPTYTTTTYPNYYAPTYREQVYKAYGLAPRVLRRLERRLP